ncbi:hypothetical protein JCM33374_g334 [Metschnikowia sp. JCM 33374]|nr:hypothetical protein JCM33374_g334 [Metschnikowia sp. JCM 33374]
MASYSTYKPEKVRLHVVAAKAFGLGAVSSVCVAVLALSTSLNTTWTRIALYTLFQCIFHTLEFFITAIYNTEETDDDSFILGDSQLHYAFVASLAESVVMQRLFSYNGYYLGAGVVIVGVGQFFRSLAMYTAGVSFNHHIQQEHAAKHKLVTGGVYRFSRHPSYFGYFWWYIGTQVVLQNWAMAAFGAYKLFSFFTIRIEYEENFLVSFFGDQYKSYKAHTPVRIPFIK